MNHLCITGRWLDDRYHALLDRDGPPEWPPSPFRLLQALVAGVARRGELDSAIGGSPEWPPWPENLAPPIIVPCRSPPRQIVTRHLPNNDRDTIPDRQNRPTPQTSPPPIIPATP